MCLPGSVFSAVVAAVNGRKKRGVCFSDALTFALLTSTCVSRYQSYNCPGCQ